MAGAACLCRSNAWDSRQVISAWYVKPEQIRKETPEGEPLLNGVVWTVGKKTFLPPAPLVMGFAYMFVLGDDASVEAHAGDRVVKQQMAALGNADGEGVTEDAEEEER